MSEKQYVIFKLGNEEYGIDIMNIREITELKQITKIPNLPNYIEGVMNLRGNIIPLINLKKRFNLENIETEKNSRIIITTLDGKQIGFIVDDASQVVTLKEDDIDNPPEMITGIDKKYITGIGKMDIKVIILLDLVSIFSDEERKEISKAQESEN